MRPFLNFSKFFSRYVSLLLILLVVITLTSCSGGSGGDDEVRGNIVELDYESSSAGPLITNFEIGPRTTLEEFSDFYVDIYLENQGSQDLTDGELSISVAYSDGLIEWQTDVYDNIELLGYNEKTYSIDEEIFEFDGFINNIPEENSELEVTLFATAKFRYNTVLEQEVCINPAQYNVVDGNCKNPDGEVRANSQYSPVVISSFEETVSERLGKAYFLFKIENKGLGEVTKINLVHAQLTAVDLICEFVEGEGEASGNSYEFDSSEQSVDLDCEYTFDPNSPAMEKVLYVDLSYDYALHDVEKLTIKKSRTKSTSSSNQLS